MNSSKMHISSIDGLTSKTSELKLKSLYLLQNLSWINLRDETISIRLLIVFDDHAFFALCHNVKKTIKSVFQ
jgi:hypothetical protein